MKGVRLDPLQRDIVGWGVLGIVIAGVGYIAIKYGLPALTNAAKNAAGPVANNVAATGGNAVGGFLQGLSFNNLTQGLDASGNPLPPTGFGGDANYNYSGYGGLSTPAAVVNQLTGGLAADAGEGIGGGLFSIFGSTSSAPDATYYTVYFPDGSRHAINASSVDSNFRFSYGGNVYSLGQDGSGNRIATPISTVYGSGSG
jgi:hypothetical protein